MSVIAHNPIMPGFYPDPSICAVGGDYYMVNSTFSYFPGLPVMHSRDLVHWEQIGNVMNRKSQLPLVGTGHSEGLFAPTIRWHEGVFYVICTNVSYGGTYIVTAEDPEGPWSEPYYLEGADGIDPSLFFDGDGKCYYLGTHPNPAGCRYDGDWYIWIQELDIGEMKLVGEKRDVWNGAMKNIIWPEGPHLYKKAGYYYIVHAEGGTGPNHAVAVCRSRDVWGPYENNFCNPILTHRHLGKEYPVKYVGHGDLIETPAGEWYMVMLAVRPREGYTTMGRETFLAKVVWEEDWPVVNPGIGMLTQEVEINLPRWDPWKKVGSFTCRSGFRNCVPGSSRDYDFRKIRRLGDEFLFLRNPGEDMYRLAAGEGLYLKYGTATLKESGSPSYIGIRQQHHEFEAEACMDITVLAGGGKVGSMSVTAPGDAEKDEPLERNRAGLVLVQSNEYNLRLEVSPGMAEAVLCEKGQDRMVGRIAGEWKEITVFLRVNDLKATLGLKESGRERIVAKDVDIRALSTEVAGGFVGCTVGMYAVADGKNGMAVEEVEEEICFQSFSYTII